DRIGVVPHRHAKLTAQFIEERAYRFLPMNVLVGVKMRWIAAHQPDKCLELPANFRLNRSGVVRNDNFIKLDPLSIAPQPLPQIEVQADAKLGMSARVLGGLPGSGPAYHQAGTGDDTLLVGPDNAAVHARTLAKVVRVDNQPALGQVERNGLHFASQAKFLS